MDVILFEINKHEYYNNDFTLPANNCILSVKLENLKEKIDAENQKKSDALKGLSKATAEAQLWRSKYETEG